jgi:5'-3' exonuclease
MGNVLSGHSNGIELDLKMVRTITASTLLYYKKKFSKYGSPIICCDSRHYWRLDKFQYYKQNRKSQRNKSKFPWELFFPMFNTVKSELEEFYPYIVMEVPGAEADDIIAVLTRQNNESTMIVSADKDLLQLQFNRDNVKQFSPILSKQISLKTNDYCIKTHYIKGDSSDGIPNILSDDDVFMVQSKRQKSITKKFLEEAIGLSKTELICPTSQSLDRYKRNVELINFDYIPDDIVASINKLYNERLSVIQYNKLRKYFAQNGMKIMFKRLEEF